jgi:hypothetical protein
MSAWYEQQLLIRRADEAEKKLKEAEAREAKLKEEVAFLNKLVNAAVAKKPNLVEDGSVAEPTSDQCSENVIVTETENTVAMACWYPQMGGFSAHALAVMYKETDSCVDVYVWHDGDWPFHDGKSPRIIHHCDPEQFINFGKKLLETMQKFGGVEEPEEVVKWSEEFQAFVAKLPLAVYGAYSQKLSDDEAEPGKGEK